MRKPVHALGAPVKLSGLAHGSVVKVQGQESEAHIVFGVEGARRKGTVTTNGKRPAGNGCSTRSASPSSGAKNRSNSCPPSRSNRECGPHDPAIIVLIIGLCSIAAATDSSLTTLSEQSGFTRTGRYDEVERLCKAFASRWSAS